LILRYDCAEGEEGKCAKLEALLTEGDTDDGEAKNNTNEQVYESKLRTAEEDPDKVHNGVAVKVGLHTASEGPDSVASDLDILKTERNKDNGRAQSDANNEMNNSHPKTVDQKPDEIAKKLHILFPP